MFIFAVFRSFWFPIFHLVISEAILVALCEIRVWLFLKQVFIYLVVVLILVNQSMKIGVDKMFEHSQLVEVTWPWAYQALCFSCGYFAYDQLDMLLYRLYSGWIPSILVHHLVLLVCFTLALYRKVTINYLILTLICEVNCEFVLVPGNDDSKNL